MMFRRVLNEPHSRLDPLFNVILGVFMTIMLRISTDLGQQKLPGLHQHTMCARS